VRLLADLPCRVRWIDARADAFPEILPDNVERLVVGAPEQAA